VSLPALDFAPLAGDVAGAVARVPAGPGVVEILGPEGRSLVLATASNLRQWAASRLGLGKPVPAGRRPRTNLAGVAAAIGWVPVDGRFRQRLIYERLLAPRVALAARRDLRPPAFLQLDPAERFPRVTVRGADEEPGPLFGPFRDRRAAEKAREALLRVFPLRPCDYVFEPDPAWPTGLGCLYAQVRSCAAPCLRRVDEEEYRALAARAAAWLSHPSARGEAPPAVPATVASVEGTRGLVVDAGRRSVGLYPVSGGRVLEEEAAVVPPAEVEAAVARLRWPPPDGPADWPWLASWLRTPRGRASYVVAGEPPDLVALAAAVRAALPKRFAAPAAGANVGTVQGEP
jgi:hypothetical protein